MEPPIHPISSLPLMLSGNKARNPGLKMKVFISIIGFLVIFHAPSYARDSNFERCKYGRPYCARHLLSDNEIQDIRAFRQRENFQSCMRGDYCSRDLLSKQDRIILLEIEEQRRIENEYDCRAFNDLCDWNKLDIDIRNELRNQIRQEQAIEAERRRQIERAISQAEAKRREQERIERRRRWEENH